MAPVPVPKFKKTPPTAANLVNLLPTGTVLAFEALTPSFSQNGTCLPANKCLTFILIIGCSIACFLSSFTDSFMHEGKIYYGLATRKGLYIFNDKEKKHSWELENYHITLIDFVHAFASLIVFLVVAISSSDVQNCFFNEIGSNGQQWIINLPLGAGLLASFLFMLFPTNRRGIGYADTAYNQQSETKKDIELANSDKNGAHDPRQLPS